LQRKGGNRPIFSVDELDSDTSAVRNLGGIVRPYLSHWPETATDGRPCFVMTNDADVPRRIDTILERVRCEEDG
jgi:hypothetical protein